MIVASLVVCLSTWYVIERTKLGSYLRAATENPALVQAFGINVPRMVTLTFGFGVALAALAGVMAAPIYQVNPLMGADIIIVVFAVVVIGGMGSIMGSILTGFGLGVVEGLTKYFYPEASNTVIFVVMVDRADVPSRRSVRKGAVADGDDVSSTDPAVPAGNLMLVATVVMAAALAIAPFVGFYPVFVMKALCFALFACAFNLLLGFGGLLSFGHAMFLGTAGYVCAYPPRNGDCTPELAIVLGTAASARARRRRRCARDPAAGHLLRDDHARGGADDVLLLSADAVHARRGWHPGGPRGKLFGLIDLGNTLRDVLHGAR